MANFVRGDIVKIVYHPKRAVIGRTAEVMTAACYPKPDCMISRLMYFLAPGQPWYCLTDVAGESRAAAHSWLERADPVPFVIAEAESHG